MWEFPESGQQALSRAFVQGNGLPCAQQQHRQFFLAALLFILLDRQLLLTAFVVCEAERGERASGAVWSPVGQANRGAEVHEGLIEVAGGFSRGIVGSEGVFYGTFHGGLCNVFAAAEYAHDDAQDVAVDGGQRQTEGDGADGTGRVASYTGESEQGVEIPRHFAMEGVHEDDGGLLEVAGSAIVAESLPEFHERLVVTGGERCDVREGCEEALVVGDNGRGSCLLEHDFGQPGVIGCRLFAPGELARRRLSLVPGEQGAWQLAEDIRIRELNGCFHGLYRFLLYYGFMQSSVDSFPSLIDTIHCSMEVSL